MNTFRMTVLMGIALLGGCASLPFDYPRTPSSALEDPRSTTLGELFAEEAAEHPGESGFAVLRYGRDAFTARIAMVDMAEKTIDVQYYIWDMDRTGLRLADALVRAADRGVRVRVLLDDLNVHAEDDRLAALAAHPKIEIRAFNPFAHRGKFFDFATDFGRINHRMHNKVIVADNAVALVGGRNIADHYFGVGEQSNFRDLDIAAVGPIVPAVSHVFDRFWNGEFSISYEAFVEDASTEADTRAVIADMRAAIADQDFPFDLEAETANLLLARLASYFTWAPGEVLFDDPEELEDEDDVLRDELAEELADTYDEFLIESAYFVLEEEGVEMARRLRERGVRIRVLTNSLASNDVVAAHAGYAQTRRDLVECGVEVYELRADPDVERKRMSGVGKSRAGLHTKAIVFDRKVAFIGSYNLDPRSRHLNTEMGLLVRSERIAEEVAAFMDGGVRPKNSYRLALESGKLVWLTEDDGIEICYDREPETGWWARFMSGFIGLLPITSQL